MPTLPEPRDDSIALFFHPATGAPPEREGQPVTRTRLEIRCTGRKVNPLNNRPYGHTCNQVFTSALPYRSRNDWLERARAAGWRVSPLQPGKTVNACCPACSIGRKPGKITDTKD